MGHCGLLVGWVKVKRVRGRSRSMSRLKLMQVINWLILISSIIPN